MVSSSARNHPCSGVEFYTQEPKKPIKIRSPCLILVVSPEKGNKVRYQLPKASSFFTLPAIENINREPKVDEGFWISITFYILS